MIPSLANDKAIRGYGAECHKRLSEVQFYLQLKQESVHVYLAKVKPFMELKTDEGKNHCDRWFLLKDKGTNRGSVLQA